MYRTHDTMTSTIRNGPLQYGTLLWCVRRMEPLRILTRAIFWNLARTGSHTLSVVCIVVEYQTYVLYRAHGRISSKRSINQRILFLLWAVTQKSHTRRRRRPTEWKPNWPCSDIYIVTDDSFTKSMGRGRRTDIERRNPCLRIFLVEVVFYYLSYIS